VILVTVYTGVGLNTELSTGAFDRFRSMPIWRPAPIIGGLIGDTARYLVASSLVIGLGLLRPAHHDRPRHFRRGSRGLVLARQVLSAGRHGNHLENRAGRRGVVPLVEGRGCTRPGVPFPSVFLMFVPLP